MLQTDHNRLVFVPSSNEAELKLVFAYKVPIAPKSVVVTLKWMPQDETDETQLRAAWSSSLGSQYIYAPASEAAGLQKGPTIKLPSRGRLEIRLFHWPSRTQVGADIISGLYTQTKISEIGNTYAGLQRIDENGFGS